MAETFDATHEPERPCPICRGDRFLWGSLRTRPEHDRVAWFQADGQSFLGGFSKQGSGEVKSRLCLRCRHLDAFVVDGEFPVG